MGTGVPYTTLFRSNRLGAENEGGSVAKHLLTFERGDKYAPGLIGRLERLRAQGGVDPVLRAELDREAVTLKALQALELKAMRGGGGSRSEERRVGKEWVSTCRSRWAPYP